MKNLTILLLILITQASIAENISLNFGLIYATGTNPLETYTRLATWEKGEKTLNLNNWINNDSSSKNHVSGIVNLRPQESSLDANLTFKLNPFDTHKDTLEFLIHQGVVINNLKGDNIEYYDVIPARNKFGQKEVPFTNIIRIKRKSNHSDLNFSMDYRATIKNDQIIFGPEVYSEEWIELAMGAGWYPLYIDFNLVFSHDITVNISPEYSILGIGDLKNTGYGSFQILSPYMHLDIIIIGSKNLLHSKKMQQQITTEVYHGKELIDKDVEYFHTKSYEILNFYNTTFGKKENFNNLKVVIPPADVIRNRETGYARNPLIMLDKYSNDFHMFAFLAHEAAHLWWNKADNKRTEDNFLNESLAEVSALLTCRKFIGQSFFDEMIASKKELMKEVEGISLYDIQEYPHLNYQLFYVKGALSLVELENKLGEDLFFQLLADSLEIRHFEEFLSLIESRFGNEIYASFKRSLL